MSTTPLPAAGAPPKKQAFASRGRGPLSRLFLTWVFPLLRLGIQRPLKDDEHLELPAGVDAETGVRNFWAQHQPGTSVLLTLWKVHRPSLLLCVAAGCTGIVAKLCSTLLVRAIAALLLSQDADIGKGIAYAAGLWACSCIDALTLTHGNLILAQCALCVYSTFAGVTYGKSKSLHPFVKPKHKRGSLINLALSETGRVIEGSLILLAGCVAPLQLVGSLIVALAMFGPEVLVMVLWVGAVTFVLRFISKKQADKFRQKMIFQSQRISTCNEMLQAIRMVKFGAWEEQFEGLLNGSRRQEEKALFHMRILHGLGNPVCNVLPVVASLSIFGIHIALHGQMPAIPDVFALIQILRAISIPFTFMGVTLSSIETLLASSRRLTDLIAEPDLVRRDVVSAAAPAGLSVSVQHASFGWTEGDATLKDVCLDVPHGQLVFVVGHLGQGKSSLMQALLGEMALADGASKGGCEPTCCVDAARGLAYAPQQAFVMNASVRDNVLFGRPFEEERYHAALHAAALDLDLEILPAGDETEIGEKGVTLSGGQRARVGLARVAYANAGLSLLDDPFAALDMEVGRHVFDHLLCGSLANAARLVASSQLHMLEDPRVDRILVLHEGRIVEDGTFAELSCKGTVFSDLIQYSGMSSGHAQKPPGAAAKQKADAQPKAATLATKKPSASPNSRMTVDETKREGAVSLATLKLYCRFVGSNPFVVLLIVLIWLFSIAEYSPDIWLSVWQEDLLGASLDFYMGVWAAILILGVVVMVVARVGCAVASARAATNIHGAVLRSLVQCPMSFFEQTPSGRILNRFGEDQFVMDVPLGMLLEAVVIILLKAFNSLVVILVSVPWVGIAVIVVLPAFWKLWAYQRATILEATRFHLVSKSPMFNTFEETLSGLPTLQAFGMEDRFLARFHDAVNHNNSWLWTKMAAQTWSEQGLMLLVSVIVATAAVCIVLMRETVLPSAAALGLIYVILLAEFLRFIFGMSAQAESSLAVVERAQELLQTAHEAPRSLPTDDTVKVAKREASVVFKNVVLRYRPHLDPALNDVSFSIAPGERVGIVGRSGSGKSTLLTALLRLVELSSGEIYIGPHNTADMGLRLLRQLVTIIPQEPVMFSGSLRWNLDPTCSFHDAVIRMASARCGIEDMRPTFSLDEEVKENGSNFSVGERQLICFARALLRSNAVMLFDEATASIDVENDARLQRVLRADFKGSTILTVAHRLGTIADSDKILALSKGRVAEFDTPAKLIQRGDGVFASLAREAGLALPAGKSSAPCEPPAEKVDQDEVSLEVRRSGPLCLQDIVLRMGHLCH